MCTTQCVPQMRLLRKITYGEFSEFIQEKKSTYKLCQLEFFQSNIHKTIVSKFKYKI